MKNKIGILVDNLHLETHAGIEKVRELGANGFQIFCTKGDMTPEALAGSRRRDFLRFVHGLGLEISALCGDLTHGFLKPEKNAVIVPRMRDFIDLASDLEVRVVTSHIGRLPQDEDSPEWKAGLEAFAELGEYAEKKGCVLAMETGPEEPVLLKRFLERIGNKGIGVNYDPANLVMGGFDHIGGVFILRDYIVHTHAKDAVRLLGAPSVDGDPYKIRRLEVPLGTGSVAFPYYLWALDAIGYRGFVTIEREAGSRREEDIREAVRFLKSINLWNGMRYNSKEGRDIEVDIPALSPPS